MSTRILDILLILLLLGSGMGSYALMSAVTSRLMLSHSNMLVIAIGARLSSLVFYRFYCHIIRSNLIWLLYEWPIPIVCVVESIVTICKFGDVCIPLSHLGHFFILLGIDVFVFFTLATIFDSGEHLGPFGKLHMSILQGTDLHRILCKGPTTRATSIESELPMIITPVATTVSPPPYPYHYSPIDFK